MIIIFVYKHGKYIYHIHVLVAKLIIKINFFCLSSAYNSCPASPGAMGVHSTRLPSFDLMARYASKLLSQHNEGRITPDSDKVSS